jgi:hypothetical protein
MFMNIQLHVSEVNAAIALFSGAAEKIRMQAEAQAQAAMQPPPPPVPPVEAPKAEHVEEVSGLTD